METRKIQTVGSGTYTVSLPKSWAESEGISAGTVVTLHADIDGLLRVEAPGHERDERSRVSVRVEDGEPERLERAVRAAYAAGFEELVLTAPDGFGDDQRGTVRAVTRTLPGVTIADESADRLTVRTLLDASEVSIRQTIRQLRFVALSMHRDATAALTGEATVEAPGDRDDEADRLFAMIDRHVGRGLSRLDEVDALGVTRPELFALWVTARELEGVADRAEQLATTAAELDGQATVPGEGDLDAVARQARQAVEDAVGVVVGDGTVDAARRALAAREAVREETDAMDRALFAAEGADYRLTHALEAVRRTAEHAGAVAELALRIELGGGELRSASVQDGDRDGDDWVLRAVAGSDE
ncbi:phosphate uptake regulator PhoU [Halorarum halobium]|uniref:phosphate uptake regulator PhoU n=1 Tax=Halorarum halobium TaxID=3075121 RepID=UPI0028AC0FA1|nr:phosphate uptake regulator PhoU [Halobaculum sp. XH14]